MDAYLNLSMYYFDIDKNNLNERKITKNKLDIMEKKLLDKQKYKMEYIYKQYDDVMNKKIPIKNKINNPPMRKGFKESPIYVSNKQIPITDWIPLPNVKMKEIKTNSWFKAFKFKNNEYGKIKTKKVTIPVIPIESFNQQMKAINKTKKQVLKAGGELKQPGFIYCKQVRLFPDENQKLILKKWFGACTEMYNITVNYIRINLFKNGLRDTKDTHKTLNFNKTREVLMNDKSSIIKKYGKPIIYTHILDEAIREAIISYTSCITNLKKGNIKKFYISERNINRSKMTMKIEKSFFKNCIITRLGKLKLHSDEAVDFELTDDHPLSDKNITMCCTLQYDALSKKYILFVPTIKPTSVIKKNQNACGIDLGVRSQSTIYSEADIMEFGVNMEDNFKIEFDKIDSIKKKIKERHNPLNSRGKINKAIKRNNKKLKKIKKRLKSQKKISEKKLSKKQIVILRKEKSLLEEELTKKINVLTNKNISLNDELGKIIPPEKTFDKKRIEKSIKKCSNRINSLMKKVAVEKNLSKINSLTNTIIRREFKKGKLENIIVKNNKYLISIEKFSHQIILLTKMLTTTDNLSKQSKINIKINEFNLKIKKLKSLCEIKSANIIYSKKKSRMQKGIRKYETRLTNKVKDMHYKIAYSLVTNYNHIYLGKLNTRSILSKRNKTISSRTKRVLQKSSPYLFGERLTYMGYKYGSSVTKVSEYLSTQTCSNCGNLNKMGSKKIYRCRCRMISDRDVNSAKTHLKLGLNL